MKRAIVISIFILSILGSCSSGNFQARVGLNRIRVNYGYIHKDENINLIFLSEDILDPAELLRVLGNKKHNLIYRGDIIEFSSDKIVDGYNKYDSATTVVHNNVNFSPNDGDLDLQDFIAQQSIIATATNEPVSITYLNDSYIIDYSETPLSSKGESRHFSGHPVYIGKLEDF